MGLGTIGGTYEASGYKGNGLPAWCREGFSLYMRETRLYMKYCLHYHANALDAQSEHVFTNIPE